MSDFQPFRTSLNIHFMAITYCSQRDDDGPANWTSRARRKPSAFTGTVVLSRGRVVPITVVDVSPDGCRVECEDTLPIAAIVQLEIGGALASAHVRWALPGEAGLQLV